MALTCKAYSDCDLILMENKNGGCAATLGHQEVKITGEAGIVHFLF